jgi:multiple sugar transport system substrate-binding protein
MKGGANASINIFHRLSPNKYFFRKDGQIMNNSMRLRLVALATVCALLISAVGLAQAQEKVTLRYALWDANQMPPYQQCADNFTAKNPNIQIKLEQLGWNDYWTALSTEFVSGNAPDVFTNNLNFLPEQISLGQLLDIQPLVERDKVPLDIYYPGLPELWTKGNARYGFDKDWDTIAIIYNKDMVKAAGITEDELNSMTWNSKDGGSFEQIIAKLTLDAKGNNGLSKDFDKNNVVQYGFTDDGLDQNVGQTEWSWLAFANGFKYNDGPWSTKYYYDDPKLAETIQWLADLWLVKGYAPKYEDQTTLHRLGLFQSGKVALVSDGSWQIGSYIATNVPVGFARLPAGPLGRVSLFNGISDSIWVGTQYKEEAWQWVKYLASADCLMVVGQSGVVFPSIPAAAEASLKVRTDKGIDVNAFFEQANEKDGTRLYPITDFGSEIRTIMGETMDNIGLGKVDAASALKKANDEVNALFK